MPRLIFTILLFAVSNLRAQYVYTIKADSVKITSCDSAELIIENHTQGVDGFLYNTGNGRTQFRKALLKVSDSVYLIGEDTLNLSPSIIGVPVTAGNGLQKIGNSIEFGNQISDPTGPARQNRPTLYNQNNYDFNWISGSAIPTFSKFPYNHPETNVLRGNYAARFAAGSPDDVDVQAGLLLESNSSQAFGGVLSFINFKNTHPSSVKRNFFGDSVSAQMIVGARQGTDEKTYQTIKFLLRGDTVQNFDQVLMLYPTVHLKNTPGPLKMSTAVVRRLAIDPGSSSNSDLLNSITYDNPYSRLVVEAANQPIVLANLPQADINGWNLIVDNAGRVWRGAEVTGGSPLRLAGNIPSNASLKKEISTTSETLNTASELSFEVQPRQAYKFKFQVIFRSSSSTGGIQLGILTPSSETFSANAVIPSGKDGSDMFFRGTYTQSGDVVVSKSVEYSDKDYIATIEGIIFPSEAGTVKLTYAASQPGSKISLRKGSLVEYSAY